MTPLQLMRLLVPPLDNGGRLRVPAFPLFFRSFRMANGDPL